jgi:hypothetical protein
MFNGPVIAALLIGATPAPGCGPTPQVEVTVDHPPPGIRLTYELNEIQALAAGSRQPLRHEAFGFYISVFGYDIRGANKVGGTPDCRATATKVRLFLVNRTIEIASDLENHGCSLDSITAHYMKHARNDDTILMIYADRIVKALRVRFGAHSFADPARNDNVYGAGTAIKEVVENVLQSFSQARQTAATRTDNEQELERLASACTRSL